MVDINQKIHLTQQGLDDLKSQLDLLVKNRRPAAVERLANARSQGDLSENQEYSQAKEELAMLDEQIEELQDVINMAVVTDSNGSGANQVSFGSRVTVELKGEEVVYHLVGEWEANPAERKISYRSPLGQKLVGRKAGDEIEVEAPIGKLVYKIVKID